MPIAKALLIKATEKEIEILTEIINKHNSKQIIVNRAKIIIESLLGKNNTEISINLKIERGSVILWRKRWYESKVKRELEQSNDKKLRELIIDTLSDEDRPGAPPIFTAEQITKIIALSCTDPKESGYPISHWTARELRLEVLKRGYVESISVTSIKRFFKRNGNKTR